MGTPFTEIYNKFLKLIDDPDLALMYEEDVKFHLKEFMLDAIHLYFTPIPHELEDMNDEGFNSMLPQRIQGIVAHAMLLVWIKPKIYKERLLRSAIADRDYSELSHANQLVTLERLRQNAMNEVKEFAMDFWYDDEDFKGFN